MAGQGELSEEGGGGGGVTVEAPGMAGSSWPEPPPRSDVDVMVDALLEVLTQKNMEMLPGLTAALIKPVMQRVDGLAGAVQQLVTLVRVTNIQAAAVDIAKELLRGAIAKQKGEKLDLSDLPVPGGLVNYSYSLAEALVNRGEKLAVAARAAAVREHAEEIAKTTREIAQSAGEQKEEAQEAKN